MNTEFASNGQSNSTLPRLSILQILHGGREGRALIDFSNYYVYVFLSHHGVSPLTVQILRMKTYDRTLYTESPPTYMVNSFRRFLCKPKTA